MIQYREAIQKLLQELVVLRADLADLEKTFMRIKKETMEIYKKLDDMLDEY